MIKYICDICSQESDADIFTHPFEIQVREGYRLRVKVSSQLVVTSMNICPSCFGVLIQTAKAVRDV